MAGQRAVGAKGRSDAVVRAFDYISIHVLLCEQQEIIDNAIALEQRRARASEVGSCTMAGMARPRRSAYTAPTNFKSRCYLHIADLHFHPMLTFTAPPPAHLTLYPAPSLARVISICHGHQSCGLRRLGRFDELALQPDEQRAMPRLPPAKHGGESGAGEPIVIRSISTVVPHASNHGTFGGSSCMRFISMHPARLPRMHAAGGVDVGVSGNGLSPPRSSRLANGGCCMYQAYVDGMNKSRSTYHRA